MEFTYTVNWHDGFLVAGVGGVCGIAGIVGKRRIGAIPLTESDGVWEGRVFLVYVGNGKNLNIDIIGEINKKGTITSGSWQKIIDERQVNFNLWNFAV